MFKLFLCFKIFLKFFFLVNFFVYISNFFVKFLIVLIFLTIFLRIFLNYFNFFINFFSSHLHQSIINPQNYQNRTRRVQDEKILRSFVRVFDPNSLHFTQKIHFNIFTIIFLKINLKSNTSC
jgi:hypothetical protein